MVCDKEHPSTALWLSPALALTLFGGGCVSTALELPADHPARPDAPAGRVVDVATTLGPGAANSAPESEPDPQVGMHHHGHGASTPATAPNSETRGGREAASPPAPGEHRQHRLGGKDGG